MGLICRQKQTNARTHTPKGVGARTALKKKKVNTAKRKLDPLVDCPCGFKHEESEREKSLGPIPEPGGNHPQLLLGYFFVLTGGGDHPAPRKGHLSAQITALGGSLVDDVKEAIDDLEEDDEGASAASVLCGWPPPLSRFPPLPPFPHLYPALPSIPFFRRFPLASSFPPFFSLFLFAS